MATTTNNNNIEIGDVINNLTVHQKVQIVSKVWSALQARNTRQSPTIGEFAITAAPVGVSMYTILAALQNWITAVNNDLLPAIAIQLAAASALSAQASTELNNKLTADNNDIQTAANNNDSNGLSAAQAQFNTDQTALSVPVTNYQGVVQALSQLLQTQTSNENMIVSMASQVLQNFVLVA